MSNSNGTSPAPPHPGGAFPAQAPATEFLPDPPVNSWRRMLYVFDRGLIVGLPAAGLLNLALLLAALAGLLRPPGPGWLLAALLVTALVVLWLLRRRERHRSFIRFVAEPIPTPALQQLAPAKKIPLYATGILSVQNGLRQFVELPGFYRTFATREHALLCRAQPRRWAGIVTWPEDELGLWYAFFQPAQIAKIQPGRLHGSRAGDVALAITYGQERAPKGAGRPAKQHPPVMTTVYLAFPAPADRSAVLADLLVDAAAALQPDASARETRT